MFGSFLDSLAYFIVYIILPIIQFVVASVHSNAVLFLGLLCASVGIIYDGFGRVLQENTSLARRAKFGIMILASLVVAFLSATLIILTLFGISFPEELLYIFLVFAVPAIFVAIEGMIRFCIFIKDARR